MTQTLSIGQLAAAAATKVNTVRFYEDCGVMPKPARTTSNRRTYDDVDLRRLRFVRRARDLGFSLDEIRTLLAISDDPSADCRAVNGIASQHLSIIQTKIERLELLRDELARISRLCSGGTAANCRILEVIGDEA